MLENWNFYHLLCLALLLATAVLHLVTCKYELPAPFFTRGTGNEIWCIHHDEKLIVPDARYLYLRDKGGVALNDYTPPVCAPFGVGGPFLAYLGFSLFGMNNLGLRFFFMLLGLLEYGLFLVLSFQVLPPSLAAGINILYFVNYNNFLLHHHAILENLLTCVLTGICLLFVLNPTFLLSNMYVIAFLAAGLILFKPNFPIYAFLLLGGMVLAKGETMPGTLWKLLAGGTLGFFTFEGLQYLILNKMKVYNKRCLNVQEALWVHGGGQHDFLQQHIKPVGFQVFLRFPLLFCDWFFNTSLRLITASKPLPLAIGSFFILNLILSALYETSFKYSSFNFALTLYIFAYLGLSAFFFFYLKRATSLFSLALLNVAMNLHSLLTDWLSFYAEPMMLLLLSAILLHRFGRVAEIKSMLSQKTTRVTDNSHLIEALVPAGATIFMHCYAYRFLWQMKKCRLISADDQLMDNTRIIDLAKSDKDAYLILADSKDGVVDKLKEFYPCLAEINTVAIESDFPGRYFLFKYF